MAGERSIAILLKLNGADEARQDLQQLNVAAIELGKAGVEGAGEWTSGFQGLERAVDKVFTNLKQGKNVSESALDPLINRYGQLKQSIEAAFGSAEAAPEEFREALNKASESVKRVNEAIDATRRASEAARAELVGTADAISQRFANIEGSWEQFRQAVDSGSPEMSEKLSRLIGQQIGLRKEIERTHGSVEQATPEIIAHYRKIETRIESAKGEVRELTAEINKQRSEVNLAGATWGGIDDALVKVAGSKGALVAKAGLVTLALREIANVVKSVESQFATAGDGIEGFSDLASSALSGVSDRIKSTQKATSQLVGELLALDGGSLDDLEGSADRVLVAMTHGAEGVRRFNLAVHAGLNAHERNRFATEQNTRALDVYNRAAAQGVRGQELLRRAFAESDKTAEGLAAALQGLASDLALLESTSGNVTMNLQRVASRQEEVNAARAASLELAAAQEEAENGITQSMREELEQIAFWLQQGPARVDQVNIWLTALEETTAKQQGLTDEERKNIATLIEQVKAISDASAATSKYTDAQVVANDAVRRLEETIVRQTAVVSSYEAQIAGADARVKELSATQGEDSIFTKQAIEEKEALTKLLAIQKDRLQETSDGLDRAKEAQQQANEQAEKFAAAMERVGAATTGNVAQFQELAVKINDMLRPVNDTGSRVEDLSRKVTDATGNALKFYEQLKNNNAVKFTDLNGELDGVLRKLGEVITKAGETEQALRKASNAGLEDGGSAPAGARK